MPQGTTWTWNDDRTKATLTTNHLIKQRSFAEDGFDKSTSNFWYSSKHTLRDRYLQATFKFTGLICKIRIRKGNYGHKNFGKDGFLK